MIVFLNKQDLLKKKVEGGRSLTKYFPDYKSYTPKENPKSEYEKSKLYMRQRLLVSILTVF